MSRKNQIKLDLILTSGKYKLRLNARTYYEAQGKPIYVIRESLNLDSEP
jgi:hypothetical protein